MMSTTQIISYSLSSKQGQALSVALDFEMPFPCSVLTRDKRFLILFGAKQKSNKQIIQIVDLLRMECRRSNVQCPMYTDKDSRKQRRHAVLVPGDRRNDKLVLGFVRQFLELPMDVI